MSNSIPKRTAVRWALDIAIAVLFSIGVGLILGWQLAPFFFVLYFAAGFAMERGQRQKKEVDAYREEWLNKRKKSEGGEGMHPDS
jgi:hypothetical protein